MLFTKQQLDNFVRVFTFLLFIACICGFLTACTGIQVADKNAFVCRETDGGGGVNVFMGSTKIRTLIAPENTILTVQEWITLADALCPKTDQAAMINAIQNISNSQMRQNF